MFDLLVGGSTIAYLGAAHLVPLTVTVHGIRVQAAIRLTWLVLFHYFLGTARTRQVLPQYPTRKLLLIHILISLYETVKFASVDLVRDPLPTVDDFFLSLAQAYTALMLAAPLRRGIPSWTRATFQAAALLRPVVSGLAIYHGSSLLHRQSVHFTDAFLWSRLWVFIFRISRPKWRHSYAYAWSIFLGAVFPVWTGALEMGLAVTVGNTLFYWLAVELVMAFDAGNIPLASKVKLETPQAREASVEKVQATASAADHAPPSPPLTPPLHARELADAAPVLAERKHVAKPLSRADKLRQFAASQGFTPLEHYMYLRKLKGDGKLWEVEYGREDEYGDVNETQGVLKRLEHQA